MIPMSAYRLSEVLALPAWNGSLLVVLVLLVKAPLILVAALAITRIMHRGSAGARHIVWLVALATLTLVPAMTAWAPLEVGMLPAPITVAAPPQPTGATAAAGRPLQSPDIAHVAHVASPRGSIASRRVSAGSATPDRAVTAAVPLGPASFALAVWAAVTIIVLASLAWSGWALRRIVRRAHTLDAEAWRTPLLEVADRIGLEETPRLLTSAETKMPFACGLVTPTIVLPEESTSWSLERRRAVLLHELAHVRRRDLVGHILARLVCAFYWFHPLVWMAAKRLRSESERACDDLALACGTRPADYAEHLLDIVTSVRTSVTPTIALAMARRKEFEGRMLAILDPELPHTAPSRGQSAALMASLALCAGLVAAVAPVPRSAQGAPSGAVANGRGVTELAPVRQEPVASRHSESAPRATASSTAGRERTPQAIAPVRAADNAGAAPAPHVEPQQAAG